MQFFFDFLKDNRMVHVCVKFVVCRMSQSNFIEWGSPCITEHQKPSTSRVKRRVRVFQSQVCRQQVVMRTSAVFCAWKGKKFFLKKLPPEK